jgi:hypothetical protein
MHKGRIEMAGEVGLKKRNPKGKAPMLLVVGR